jgi:hypothetical protein
MKLLLVALLAASSLPVYAQASSPSAACGSASISFSVKLDDKAADPPKPAPDKAMLYFIQDEGVSGSLAYPTTRLGIDGAWGGANKESSYFPIAIDPGEHHICVMVQSSLVDNFVELAHFTAEPGKAYYYRTRILLARGLEYLELMPIDSDQGRYLITSVPLSIPKTKK